jgi:hypothetical protein
MRIIWRVLAALVLIAAIAGIGLYAYNIGMAQGVAQQVQSPAVQPNWMPFAYFGYPFFGFGFGILACLIPFFLLLLVFGSLRTLFWRGPMGWRHMHRRHWDWHDENGKGVPPFFSEWHDRAHGKSEAETDQKHDRETQ